MTNVPTWTERLRRELRKQWWQTLTVILAIGLGAGLWLAFTGDDGEGAVGGAASLAQGDVPACGADAPFTFTLTAEGKAFDYTTLALPAGVEVALTLDNRDKDVTHSIIFYAADSPEPYHPDGCLCGCGGDGPQLRSEPVTGVARQTFTFESPPPGRYLFWCDYHPDVMVGELVVLE